MLLLCTFFYLIVSRSTAALFHVFLDMPTGIQLRRRTFCDTGFDHRIGRLSFWALFPRNIFLDMQAYHGELNI